MGLAAAAFILMFGAMNAVYLFFRASGRRAQTRALALRVERAASEPTAEPPASARLLIRKDQTQHAGWLRSRASSIYSEERLRLTLERSGVQTTPARLIRTCLIAAAMGGVLAACALPRSLGLLALPSAAVCGAFPVLRLRRRVQRRLNLFEEQFPDGLEFISRSMRAGHAFSVSLEMMCREFDEPMAGEFRRIFEEQNLGLPLELALEKFALRVPILDVQFFTSAVILQKKTGGNLTEILDKLAQLIRERYKLRGKIKAVSAHGRMTGKVLCAIPMFVGVLMFFVNHDYAHFFFGTTTGKEMLAASVGLQFAGYLVIQRIVKIEI